MKRRQKPIILITVLVICGGLVFIMTSAQNQKPSDAPPPSQDATPPSGQNVPVPDKASMASNVKQSISGMPGGPGGMAGHMPKGKNIPGMPGSNSPSILNESAPAYSPQPSDTGVNGGWYSNEAPPSYTPPKKK